ncbi:hypothetical protein VT03_05865 [Planctomyces sp. SH-PL14]|nr:hypothetical protein VT03_05865 [Planctomyces sp. SH-PL14]
MGRTYVTSWTNSITHPVEVGEEGPQLLSELGMIAQEAVLVWTFATFEGFQIRRQDGVENWLVGRWRRNIHGEPESQKGVRIVQNFAKSRQSATKKAGNGCGSLVALDGDLGQRALPQMLENDHCSLIGVQGINGVRESEELLIADGDCAWRRLARRRQSIQCFGRVIDILNE